MGALLIVLIARPLVSIVVALLTGAAMSLRDRQVPTITVVVPDASPVEQRTIVIPEPRSACRAETEARIPSR
jgi:hypothetical protein